MHIRSLLIIIVGVVGVAALSSPNASAETLRIRGSVLAFERLSSARELLARSSPDIEIDWTGYGSTTALSALPAGDASDRHAPAAEIRETAAAIVDAVASEPRALGVVSMVVDRTSVKTVSLRGEDGGVAVLPTVESVGRDDYPLGRALFLYYQRNTAGEALRRTVSWLLLTSGRREIAKAGFVALPADRAILRTLQSKAAPVRLTVSTVSFPSGSSRLNRDARRVLDGVSEVALREGADVWVTGHSEPQEEPANERGLSVERAATVASYLRERGVAVSRAEGRGTAEPRASSDTPDGRRENRRADVWILPRH